MYSCFLALHNTRGCRPNTSFSKAQSPCNYQPFPSVLAANPWSGDHPHSRGKHKAHQQRWQRHWPSPTLRSDCSKAQPWAQTEQPLGLLQCSNTVTN